jgi:hypothetical protein
MTPDNTEAIKGRFQKGQSGNPAGKPKGTRHKTTIAMQALLDGQGEALAQKAIYLALDGDLVALRLCLERLLPARKDSHVSFSLPEMKSARDTSSALAAILEAVSIGDLSPIEAQSIAALIETYRKTLETTELETRIKQLEERAGK